MPDNKNDILRAIPPVDDLLEHETVVALRARHPQFPWTRFIRSVIDEFRASPPKLRVVDREAVTGWIVGAIECDVMGLVEGGQRRVLNGTGVVLHTNLGRAPLSPAAADAGREALAGYVTLEVDIETGSRGPRAEAMNRLVLMATGGEACMVVNNNAAAVYLVTSTFSPPGRVIVSRGELVEIGGSFRLPEILRHAAAEVVEIGTTNRTYADDYRKVARAGDIILKVHKSNYAIEGFAHEASIDELAGAAADTGAHLVYDLGSGAVFDFRAHGLGEDASVSDELARGVDCVTMSGDKLFGGPQAGIIVGRESFVKRLRQNPLRRAMRVDKVTIAVMQQVLRDYLFGDEPKSRVPTLNRIFASPEELRTRAERVTDGLVSVVGTLTIVEDDGAVGGGSLASVALPSIAIAVKCGSERDAVALARRMRRNKPSLFPRIKDDEVRVNMIAIGPDEDQDLRSALDATLLRMERQ